MLTVDGQAEYDQLCQRQLTGRVMQIVLPVRSHRQKAGLRQFSGRLSLSSVVAGMPIDDWAAENVPGGMLLAGDKPVFPPSLT